MLRLFENSCAWNFAVATALLFACSACGPQVVTNNAPLSPSRGLSQTIGSGNVTFYRWDDEPTVMICSDIRRASGSARDSANSGPPRVRKAEGSLSAQDGRRLDWWLEERDGRMIKCRLNERDFDLKKGALFLVQTKGGKTEIEQVRQNLSSVKLDIESLKAFARQDSAVSKLLEIGEE